MNIEIVTSFSEEGYRLYGKRFIDSYFEVGNTLPLKVYTDGDFNLRRRLNSPSIMRFETYPMLPTLYLDNPFAQGIREIKDGKALLDYRFQATKFARKVYAVTDQNGPAGWRVWIDADVEWVKPIDEPFIKRLLPETALFSYIGRTDMHSECGFVGYRTDHPTVITFLNEFRRLYTSGEVFRLGEWHDSYVFDFLRQKSFIAWGDAFHDIAAKITLPAKDRMHPWPHTMLGKYMIHNKGPVAKTKAYGGTV